MVTKVYEIAPVRAQMLYELDMELVFLRRSLPKEAAIRQDFDKARKIYVAERFYFGDVRRCIVKIANSNRKVNGLSLIHI